MRRSSVLLGMALLACSRAPAQIPATAEPTTTDLPFAVTEVATFDYPWKIAFLPDGRMLVTEKTGGLWLVTQAGTKARVAGVPPVFFGGQLGLLGVFTAPGFARNRQLYLTYAEPGDGGSGLALARARLVENGGNARLDGLQVLWRDLPRGEGGQPGAVVAFAPDGRSLFLTVGERQRMTPAQDPNTPLGKIVHLTLDGAPAPDNPGAGRTGTPTRLLLAPPRDTEAAKTAPTRAVPLPGPNRAPAEIWASGIRTPYGLAFDPQGRLWEMEHGPRGGDELNLVRPGANFGWPLVSYGQNYNGVPIPSPDTRPDLDKPVIYWNPVIGPAGLVFYKGAMFPEWNGSALAGGLVLKGVQRITFDGKGGAAPAERWSLGKRIRDVAVAPDGAIWLVEDKAQTGALMRLTPRR